MTYWAHISMDFIKTILLQKTWFIAYMNGLKPLTGAWKSDVVYLDFQKDFDSVKQTKLILKSFYGFHPLIIRWLKHHLSFIEFKLGINESFYDQESVLSRVLQGTVLGLLIFILFTSRSHLLFHPLVFASMQTPLITVLLLIKTLSQ